VKIAIYSRGVDADEIPHVKSLFAELAARQTEILVWGPFWWQIGPSIEGVKPQIFESAAELDKETDCMISLGGDGTLLDTVTLVRDKGIPILGINFGRLGFLASVVKEELVEAVEALLNRTYVTDERILIHVDGSSPLFEEVPYGLNEFAIHKNDISPMIKVHTYLNGEFLNTYWADGLIVATPTGSTGYSVSCGGPIVFPNAGSFVITPVAPHNLNVRPIIVPDDTVISFEIEGRMEQFICALDSRRQIVDKKVQIAVKKEIFTIKLIRIGGNNFLQTLRNKLSWGLDKRN
jgi:NAD+ kinase